VNPLICVQGRSGWTESEQLSEDDDSDRIVVGVMKPWSGVDLGDGTAACLERLLPVGRLDGSVAQMDCAWGRDGRFFVAEGRHAPLNP